MACPADSLYNDLQLFPKMFLFVCLFVLFNSKHYHHTKLDRCQHTQLFSQPRISTGLGIAHMWYVGVTWWCTVWPNIPYDIYNGPEEDG